MRILPSRTTTLWYSLKTGEQEEQDAYGHYTGRFTPTYSAPLSTAMMVSPEKANTQLAETGLQESDTRQIITNDMDVPWDNTTILWIGKEPFDAQGNRTPHNYVVDSVQRSLFAVGIIAKRVIVGQ